MARSRHRTPVIGELQARGVPVLAPANPLRGLAGDAAYIASYVTQVEGPVLLVGHSYGGAVISVAAAAAANVVGLVYVAAWVLDEGESPTTRRGSTTSTRSPCATRGSRRTTPTAPARVVISILDRHPRKHPRFRPKLDAVGFGLLIPIFYAATGIQLDLRGLLEDTSALLRVPVFLVVRGVPAARYSRTLGARQAIAAGFLQATSLPFIVASTEFGVAPLAPPALVLQPAE